MNGYFISEIKKSNGREMAHLDALLQQESITRDSNLDYTAGLFDKDYNLIATGSCYTNTLRCLAVDRSHQGEGLLNEIVTHLVDYQMQRGISHLFIYTKAETAPFFAGLGFYEIAGVDHKVSFMENRKNGFSSYLHNLQKHKNKGRCAAVVMNCNPFTLGHQYLIEETAKGNDHVHLFIVSEDMSVFPFADRFQLVQEGCAHIDNITFHQTGSYMISNAVFPSYFLKDENAVITSHSLLDAAIFTQIAQALAITRRYLGEEPFSRVTNIYNGVLQKSLPEAGIECVVLPRKQIGGQAVSASNVRKLIQDGRLQDIKPLVPDSTFQYFFTEKGKAVIERIKNAGDVAHY